MPRVLLIDNVDSFTFNIADLLHRVLGEAPTVWRHDHVADDLSGFDAIVVGPGPGRPQRAADMGLSDLALRQRQVPVLGVCLGHQGMAHLAGDAVVELGAPMHGRVSKVVHDGTGLFEDIPSPFSVVRYHSLEVRPAGSSPLVVTARAADDGVVMALADPVARRWGVQFHPESVLSEHGERLATNFLRMAGVRLPGRLPQGGVGHAGSAADGLAAGDTAGGASSTTESVAVGDVHRHTDSGTVGARAVRLASVVLGGAVDTWELHQRLYADSPTSFWLDASTGAQNRPSGAPPLPPSVRCSVLGDASGPLSYVLTHRVGEGTQLSTGERLDGLLLPNLARLRDRLVMRGAVEVPTGFRPGFVGYLGYELKAELDGSLAHRSPFPDARLVLADRALVVDHEQGMVHGLYLWDDETRSEQEAWVERLRRGLEEVRAATSDRARARAAVSDRAHAGAAASDRARVRILHGDTDVSCEGSRHVHGTAPDGGAHGMAPDGGAHGTVPDGGAHGMAPDGGAHGIAPDGGAPDGGAKPEWRHTRETYLDLVAQCQKQIGAGESYEICLTNAARWPRVVDETRLAAAMRTASPVPFAAWLRGPGPTVISASPERLVSVTADGFVQARPIKGTRPRGADPVSDAALAEELHTSVKDRAENLMIVDLLRNDLHRVCRSGSVHVPGIFEVESYATVHQLVSTVRGQLAEGMGPTDVLRACFPGGSMTGAPKVRTMEILDGLEGAARGIYSGAIGWIGLDGSMDTSIVIRTLTWADGDITFGVGGAVTALSDPAEEHAEMTTKARSVRRALALAGAPGGASHGIPPG